MGLSEATGTFDCLGATRFYSGKPQASFTATVVEAGTFVLSSSDSDWTIDRSSLSVSGGHVESDVESFRDDEDDFEAACKFGRCDCIRRISVSAASTVTFKHRTQSSVLANRFHFFPRDRKSVAIDALFCRTFHVHGFSGSCEYIPGYVTGSGVYVAGETATFTAVPAPGEAFDHWEVVYGTLPTGLNMADSTLSFRVDEGMCGAMKDEQQIVLRAVWKDRFYRDVLALPVGAAVVAGNLLAQEGESVSVTLHPDKECTLRNWSDGGPNNLSRTIYVGKRTAGNLIYAFFDGMPSMGDLPFDADKVVPGEAVSIDTGLIGYTVKKLPSGLKYNKMTGQITGAAKKPTGESGVTVTFTKKGEADVSMTFVVGPIPTISVTLEGDTEKCKVTGGNKAYLVGKKVSLMAKGPKGTAFVGWFKDGEPWPSEEECLEPKIKYVMTAESLNLVARFKAEEVAVACDTSAGCAVKVPVSFPVTVDCESGLKTVSAKKLPSGLKYNKRTGCIEGAAKKAGTYPFSLTVTTKAGSKVTQDFELVVAEEKLEEEKKPYGGVQLWENGPYWAECNVGATKPEEYGYYFWWGDTVGYKFGGGTLSELGDGVYRDVTWVSSAGRWMSSSPFDDCPTEYKDNSQLRSEGYIDRTGNLTAAHDAATAHLGAPWRMPTDAEFEALISTCITTWTTRNGVYGMLVTGKDAFASQSIFLPAAGYAWYNELSNVGSYGYCWSATPTSDNARRAWELVFGSDELGRSDGNRHRGRSVRPVRGFAK